MNVLFFDIETVPTERVLHESGLVEAQAITPEQTDLVKKLSLSGATARILCIGYAMEPPANAPVQILHDDERAMLHEFWRLAANTHLFVGHNVLEFDLRFIWQRSIIHQIKPTRDISFARHHSEPIYDTMQEWSKWGREHISLAGLSRALDIPSPKEKLDGAKVYPYYREGRLAEICDYCKRDVESVRAVYRRLTFSSVAEL